MLIYTISALQSRTCAAGYREIHEEACICEVPDRQLRVKLESFSSLFMNGQPIGMDHAEVVSVSRQRVPDLLICRVTEIVIKVVVAVKA